MVEKNLFEKCNGETECISNKSCGNIYRENTFLEVSGTLTLRHGNGCIVERNVFSATMPGERAASASSARITSSAATTSKDLLATMPARRPLFMMGIPNSPANRYLQVKRAHRGKQHDRGLRALACSSVSATIRTPRLPPVETVIRGNQILSPKHAIVEARCGLDGITWKENTFSGKSLGIPAVAGIEIGEPKLQPLKPIRRDEVGTKW